MKRKLLSAFAMILLLGISRAAFAERAVPVYPEIKTEYTNEIQPVDITAYNSSVSLLAESQENGTERYGRTAIGKLGNGAELVKIYDMLVSGIRNFDKKITVSINFKLTNTDAKLLTDAIVNDNPDLFWFGIYADKVSYFSISIENSVLGEYVYNFYPEYNVNSEKDQLEKVQFMKNQMETAADEFIKQANITEGMTDYDKALALHDVVCANLAYDDSQSREWIHTVYGAFVNKYAVCDGYSKAYQYLLNKVGIDSHIATGAGNGGSHAWNLVKLGDKWYYTDVTWDDQPYLDFYYEYFNLTEEQLTAKDHEINKTDYPLPICDTRFYIYKSKSSDMRAEWYTEPYTNDSGKVQFNAKIRDSVTVIRVYYDKNGVLIHQNSLFNRNINGTGNNGETVIFGEAVSENIKKSVAETKYMLWRGGTMQPICDMKIAS